MTSSRIAWSRRCTAATVAASTTSPHQVPSISQPSDRHTRRISTRLTTGRNPPIDFSGSVVQMDHRYKTVVRMVKTPATLSRVAAAAACGARRP